MARYGDEYDGFGKPRAVKGGGIKAKSERGNIGATWWSKRWIGVLESFGMGTRLTRGRTYARKGQVAALEIAVGEVKAKVQGSQPKPYNVSIKLKPLTGAEWDSVTTAMAGEALFAAELLAGEMPTDIEKAFQTAKVSLLPISSSDLTTSCSCPDWANPCKHVAAVYYLLAENFDDDPFLLFKLRGMDKARLIEILREKRSTLPTESAVGVSSTSHLKELLDKLSKANHHPEIAAEEVATNPSSANDDDLSNFWETDRTKLDQLNIQVAAPPVANGLLKRLGEAPFQVRGNHSVTPILGKAYTIVSEAALKKAVE